MRPRTVSKMRISLWWIIWLLGVYRDGSFSHQGVTLGMILFLCYLGNAHLNRAMGTYQPSADEASELDIEDLCPGELDSKA